MVWHLWGHRAEWWLVIADEITPAGLPDSPGPGYLRDLWESDKSIFKKATIGNQSMTKMKKDFKHFDNNLYIK